MNEQDSNMAMNAIAHAANMSQASIQQAVCEWGNPSAIYRPKLMREGNKWMALYGDNIQEGVCGFGDNPAAAMTDFNREWYKPIQTMTDPTP